MEGPNQKPNSLRGPDVYPGVIGMHLQQRSIGIDAEKIPDDQSFGELERCRRLLESVMLKGVARRGRWRRWRRYINKNDIAELVYNDIPELVYLDRKLRH